MSFSSDLIWTLEPGEETRLRYFRSQTTESWSLTPLRALGRRAAFAAIAPHGEKFFLKTFLPQRILGWDRAAWAANRERTIAQRLSGSGIRVPRWLAQAANAQGQCWHFQEWVEATPWDQIAGHPAPAALRDFGRMLLRLHRLGLRDSDRHAGNFLCDRSGKTWAIDFRQARIGPALDHKERIEALAVIEASLLGSLSPRERARWLRECAKESESFRDWVLDIEARAISLRARTLRRKAASCLRENRRFAQISLPGFEGFCRADANAVLIANICADWRQGCAREIKRGRRSRVAALGNEGEWIVKSYRVSGALAGLRRALGLGRARRAWRRAFHLELCGDLGAHALALLEGTDEDLLISQRLTQGADIAQTLQGDADRARAAAHAIGEWLARLHLGGLRARDLRVENLHLTEQKGCWTLRLLDFDGLRPWRDFESCPSDWGRLFASLPRDFSREKLRMLRAYARAIYGIASRPRVRRLAHAAFFAERSVRERWIRQGKT